MEFCTQAKELDLVGLEDLFNVLALKLLQIPSHYKDYLFFWNIKRFFLRFSLFVLLTVHTFLSSSPRRLICLYIQQFDRFHLFPIPFVFFVLNQFILFFNPFLGTAFTFVCAHYCANTLVVLFTHTKQILSSDPQRYSSI